MISSNMKEFMNSLSDFEKKQIPFASKVALNNTAEIAMEYGKKKIDKDFNITSKSWNKVGGRYGLRKKAATKSRQFVEIFIPDENTWIRDHEDGTTRMGTQLIPTREFKKQYPNIKGNAQIKAKAKKLLSNQTKNRVFMANIGSDSYVFQRKKGKVAGTRQRRGKSGRLLKAKSVLSREAVPLFLIHKQGAKQKRVLEFYQTIHQEFGKHLDDEFRKAFVYAMRTAR